MKLAPALLAPVLLLSCDNGVRSAEAQLPPATIPGSADFVLASSGTVELEVLSAPVLELRLLRADGETANLLAGPRELDLADLDGLPDAATWLARAEVPPGTYTGVVLRLDATRFRALAPGGGEPTVVAAGAAAEAEFPVPVDVVEGDLLQVAIELRLDEAVTLVEDRVEVDLRESVDAIAGVGPGPPLPVDEVFGVVVGALALQNALVIEAFADLALEESIGTVVVVLGNGSLLFDQDARLFPNPLSFFSSLAVGDSVVRVRGQLVVGTLAAQRIDIVGSFQELAGLVALEGTLVASSGAPQQAFLLDVDFAADGMPREVALAPDAVVLDPDGAAGVEELAPPRRVRVSVPRLDDHPLRAAGVELLDRGVELAGTVRSPEAASGGLAFVLELDAPAPELGVDSASLEVELDPDAEVTVDLPQAPRILPADVRVGDRVRVRGALGGGATPVLRARELAVRPGLLLDAAVDGLVPGDAVFTTSNGHVGAAFSGSLPAGTGGPFEVRLDPQATYHHAASSQAHFLHVVGEALASGSATVRVRGIAGAVSGTLRAFEVTTSLGAE